MMQNDSHIDKLSDAQLYALVINPDLSSDIKSTVTQEFNKRDFSQEYIDKLALEYEMSRLNPMKALTPGRKLE